MESVHVDYQYPAGAKEPRERVWTPERPHDPEPGGAACGPQLP